MKTIFAILLLTYSITAAGIKEIKKNIPLKNIHSVELAGFSGATLTVRAWDKNEIGVDLRIDYTSSNKELEQEYFQKVNIAQEESNDRMKLVFVEPNIHEEGFSLKKLFSFFTSSYSDLNITGVINVPASCNLISDMRYGTYVVEGVLGNLELAGVASSLQLKNCTSVQKVENNYGTLTVDHCGGNLKLDGMSSKISISDFTGSIDANVDYSTVTLASIKSDATIHCTSGTLDITDMGGNISLNAEYTKINAVNIKGMVTIESQSAVIRTKQMAGAHINAPYSNIKIENILGAGEPVYVKNLGGETEIVNVSRDVTIVDSYSRIQLSSIQGNISVEGQSSALFGKKINGNLQINNSYADMEFTELSASTVTINNKNNKVNIDLITKPLKVDILNEYGPVSISLPDFAGSVRLKASYGKISTNLPLETEELDGGAIAFGKVGNGSGTMTVKTMSGDITVKQRK